jgi:release factor glutamine methyltransferase
MTVEKLYKEFSDRLTGIYEAREAVNISDWVFEKIASLKRIDRITNRDKQLGESTIIQLNNALERLLSHEPVQYVLEEAWFYKRKFVVNKHVLIPRPETEELVEEVVEKLRIENGKWKILDIGTGSGCIAISVKKELPYVEATAIDVSEEAIVVARENAVALNADVTFMQLDFLNEIGWNEISVYDLIISNPPYIPIQEKMILSKNVTEHEPGLALFVPDNDPFIFYKKIASFSNEHLRNGGSIYVEVHENYAKQVEQIFIDNNFNEVFIKQDIYGKERIVRAIK